MALIIVNKKEFDAKLKKIKRDGYASLHLVADFDNTLTKAYINGNKFQSAMAQIRQGNFLSKDYSAKAQALYEKYHPIEIDPEMNPQDKDKYMIEWWTTHLELQRDSGMSKIVLNKVVDSGRILLRDNTEKLFELLQNKNIPILIISAGLGDLINLLLNRKKINYDNVHVISNFYNYDKEGLVLGYKGKIIHSFNKDETEIKVLPHYNELLKRKNIILLGDSLGDTDMSKGFDHEVVLKIGFLNDNNPELLKKYKELYDVLITEDGSVDFVIELIEKI